MSVVITFFKPNLGHMVIKHNETFAVEAVPEKLGQFAEFVNYSNYFFQNSSSKL